jgi:hypothetical protein
VAGAADWEMISTLLGPEGTTGPVRRRLHCGGDGLLFQNYPGMASDDIPAAVSSVWCCLDGVVGWLLVENCTVDASILFSVG